MMLSRWVGRRLFGKIPLCENRVCENKAQPLKYLIVVPRSSRDFFCLQILYLKIFHLKILN